MTIQLFGSWKKGFAYDYHIIQSVFQGYDEHGNPIFDTQRTPMGQLLYELKYKNQHHLVDKIVDLLTSQFKFTVIDVIVPAPSSTVRAVQPVVLIAQKLAMHLNRPMWDILQKIQTNQPIKNMSDYDEKSNSLADNIILNKQEFDLANQNILLIDDLYDSGATLNYSAQKLLEHGAKNIYVLAMTKTRG